MWTKKHAKNITTVTVAQYFAHTNMPCLAGLMIQFFLGVLHILGFCNAHETEQGAYSVWSVACSLCMLWVLLVKNVYKFRCKGG